MESVRVTPIDWIKFKEFLESHPPGSERLVDDIEKARLRPEHVRHVATPTLELYCDSDECQDHVFFDALGSAPAITEEWRDIFLIYLCRHCQKTSKTFALRVCATSKVATHGNAIKYGELPPFGPHIPSRVITLIREDRALFAKGRRAESQGLGIGAYGYYRRVIENQKDRLLEEIRRVAERESPDSAILGSLDQAMRESQFNKAVDMVKDAIPPPLLIQGQNPLQLLHAATSKGIHELSDEECLERATDIRRVLTEFVERVGQALKDDKELRESVARLTQRQRPSDEPGNASSPKK